MKNPILWCLLILGLDNFNIFKKLRATATDINILPQDDNATEEHFHNVLPLNYRLKIILPRRPYQQTFNGTLETVLYIRHETNRLCFHTKDLDIPEQNISIVRNDLNRFIHVLQLQTYLHEELICLHLAETLMQSYIYIVKFGVFHGIIRSADRRALFIIKDTTANSDLFATQFQLAEARSVFPCIDLPSFKATLSLTIQYRWSNYTVLSNTPAVLTTESNGWWITSFQTTPKMPTYTMAFVLFSSNSYRFVSLTSALGLRLTIYYNPNKLSYGLAKRCAEFAKYATDYLDKVWKSPLPLEKLDIVIISSFPVFGMENWGIILLNEQFILRPTGNRDEERLSLIAHEIAHQWFSNMVTIAEWRQLCFQESMAEHYSRRIVRQYLMRQRQHSRWQEFMAIRYAMAMKQEEREPHPDTMFQSFTNLSHITNLCFNRAPFIISMLENYVGVRKMDKTTAEFIGMYQYGNVLLNDYAALFDSGPLLVEWFHWTDCPLLSINRNYETQSMNITQGTGKLMNGMLSTGDDNLWKLPMIFLSKTNRTNSETILLNRHNLIVDIFPINSGDWLLINPTFHYFYRVKYDLRNMLLLTEALNANVDSFNFVTILQILSDYCFFKDIYGFTGEETFQIEKHLKKTAKTIFLRLYYIREFAPSCYNL